MVEGPGIVLVTTTDSGLPASVAHGAALGAVLVRPGVQLERHFVVPAGVDSDDPDFGVQVAGSDPMHEPFYTASTRGC